MKIESSPIREKAEVAFLQTNSYSIKKTIKYNWNKRKKSTIT